MIDPRAARLSRLRASIPAVQRTSGFPKSGNARLPTMSEALADSPIVEWWQNSVRSRRREDLFATESSLVAQAARSLVRGLGPS